jgi:hypothetical protein
MDGISWWEGIIYLAILLVLAVLAIAVIAAIVWAIVAAVWRRFGS